MMGIQSNVEAYDPSFMASLPEAYSILRMSNLTIHPWVSRIVLHGSRGLAGGYRTESDIDLSLLLDLPEVPAISKELGDRLREILQTTLSHWEGPVEADLAAIFPLYPCSLRCFDVNDYDPSLCLSSGVGCFGIYKIQKGFNGFVLNTGLQVAKMYPCITVWRKEV